MNVRVALASVVGALVAVLSVGAVAVPSALGGECPNEALRSGPSAGLPDCRAYEQVSPAQKNGYDAVKRGMEYRLAAQASANGDAIAYLSNGAFSGATLSALPVGHVSRRTAEGWQTTELTPPASGVLPPSGTFLGYAYSEDLSQTILKVPLLHVAEEGEPDGVYNLFLRDANGTYHWINAAVPPKLPPAACPTAAEPECFKSLDLVSFAGGSADFQHILFEASASLASNGAEPAPEGPEVVNLYEESGGAVHAVGVLPDGTLSPGGSWAGSNNADKGSAYQTLQTENDSSFGGQRESGDMEHAISANGQRVLFESIADGGAPDPEQNGKTEVYDRIEGKRTIELSAPAAAAAPKVTTAEPARFWAASPTGSRVYFTSSAELTSESNTGTANSSEDLYEYSFEREENGEEPLRDLSVDTNAADETTGAGVLGVVGAGESEEGGVHSSYVYFVAKGQLVAGKGVDGEPNLYVVHDGGAPTFIATLKPGLTELLPKYMPGDSRDWTGKPAELQAYVTPDGRSVAFMSLQSLPTVNFPGGYDNVDESTGEPDTEVYAYDAGEGVLTCVSCDPTGQPPTGGVVPSSHEYYDGAYLGESPVSGASSTPFHQPRTISDNGKRVFFTAPPFASERGTATPNDKVYEWEAYGEGSCREARGCIFRISSATSGSAGIFLDAGAQGNNVYFGTSSQLVPADTDGLFDVYDARSDGGFVAQPAPTPCSEHCRAESGAGATSPGLVSNVIGAPGNLPLQTVAQPEQAPTKTKGNEHGKKKAQAHKRRRRLAACRRHARHRKNHERRRRALRRCVKRYGRASRHHRGKRMRTRHTRNARRHHGQKRSGR